MKLNNNLIKNNLLTYICSNTISIAISDRKIFDVYCCRAYNSIDNRIPYEEVLENTEKYLDNTINSEFRVCNKYPCGYCIKYQSNVICKDIIKPRYITGVSLGTITKCNYNCPNCAQKYNEKSGLTSGQELDLTCKIIDTLSKYNNINFIQLSNAGEISMYDTSKIADCIKNNKNIKYVDILTNGSNYFKINEFINKLNDIHISLHINIYSSNNVVYHKLTGQSKVSSILNTIKNYDCDDITLNYILFKENINEFQNIIDYIHENNFKLYISANMYDESMHNKLLEFRNSIKDSSIIFEGSGIKL